MRNLYYFVVLVTTIFLPITVVNAASLIDIYHEALQHDTQYKIARHSYLANQEKLPQGRAGLLPNIEFAGRARTTLLDTENRSEATINNRGIVITATQPLFRVENFLIYQQAKK